MRQRFRHESAGTKVLGKLQEKRKDSKLEDNGQKKDGWEIRKTRPEQIEEVMEIYARARAFMAEHGNPNQWGQSRPPKSAVENDIESGNSYVCMVEGKVAAVFYYHVGDDPTYAVIEGGQWLNGRPYGVVHRIAADGKTKGAGSFCLNWAVSQCGNLRIDTHRDNVVMQNVLKKNGFQYCGIIYIEDGDERLAFQRCDF